MVISTDDLSVDPWVMSAQMMVEVSEFHWVDLWAVHLVFCLVDLTVDV